MKITWNKTDSGFSMCVVAHHLVIFLNRVHCFSDVGSFSWLSSAFQDSLEEIQDLKQFKQHWLHAKFDRTRVRFVYVSKMNRTPLLFASLKAKFRDRFSFGKYTLKRDSDLSVLQEILNLKSELPEAFVCLLSNQKVYIYANDEHSNNFLHFNNLCLFLQLFNPDINLLFTWSIYFCNLLATLSFFLSSGHIFPRCITILKSFLTYNAVLLVSWLVLSSYMPQIFVQFLDLTREYAQTFATTRTASNLRGFLRFLIVKPFFVCIGFGVFVFFTVLILRKFNIIRANDVADSLADILLLNENHSVGYNDISRRWVERLATPALWLEPLIPSDYIENLPVWKYTGECRESTDDSDSSADTRTFSVSPDRGWTSHPWRKEPRSRTCSSNRDSASKRLRKGLLWSLKSFFRGRSPRYNRISRAPEGMREEQPCSVCLENYKSHSPVCGLPCGHVFHHDCILQWLHSDKHCCPVCRWPAYQAR